MLNMEDKMIIAFRENKKDLSYAKKAGDFEEEAYCKGYETAMLYVLSLLGVSYTEALSRKIKG